jgi:aldehyde:ferredoxin oxidoreductase
MGNGYWQKLLRVDLTNKKVSVEPVEDQDLKRYRRYRRFGNQMGRFYYGRSCEAYLHFCETQGKSE